MTWQIKGIKKENLTLHNLHDLDQYRETDQYVLELFGSIGDQTCGVFRIPSPIDKALMLVIASSGMGWDHVSVSRENRCPNWPEMSYIKKLFFFPQEVVMQLHVAENDHINVHHNCLHLWRPQFTAIPLPPTNMVA